MIKITPVDSSGNAVTLLAQWDRGVTIYLSSDLISDAHPVHFQNARTAEAIVMESTYEDDILSVEVPDVLLERTYPITGFVFVTDDDSGRSLLVFEIQVRPRPKPADTVYENTQEYLTVSSLLEQLTDAVETAQAAAESAAEYAGGIVSIEQTVTSTESSGENVVTITATNGTTTDFSVYNGAQGEKGDTGNVCWATFDVVADTGELELTMPDDYSGLEFSIDDSGYLEVTYA